MSPKELSNDLNNCLINFDKKVLVTNLLDEYGGLLEEIARTVNKFLSAEEAKGKQFLKTFLLRGIQSNSENELFTVVTEEKLKKQEEQLRDAHSVLYSVETVGGSKSPPTEFVPLKHIGIKLNSLEMKDVSVQIPNGSVPVVVKEEKLSVKKTGALGTMFKKQETNAAVRKNPENSPPKKIEPEKKTGALGTMFKKQEANAAAGKSPEKSTPKKIEPEKKISALGTMFKKQEANEAARKSPEKGTPKKIEPEKKTGALGTMFKNQETTVVPKKSPKVEPEKKSNTLGAMFMKQESTAASKKSPDAQKNTKSASGPASKKETTKKEEKEKLKPSVIKPASPKKISDCFKKGTMKPEEEPVTNVSVNLFDESASSDDEEALDALKRKVLTDDEEEKPSTSHKRRRIVDSEEEDSGPEVKVERKEVDEVEVMEIEDDEPKTSATFMDEDGFIVTVKAKNKKPMKATRKSTRSPVKVKKESPKTPAKKEATSKTPAVKKKQGNIMNFFTKK